MLLAKLELPGEDGRNRVVADSQVGVVMLATEPKTSPAADSEGESPFQAPLFPFPE